MAKNADATPLRYAHPFYTPTPPDDRAPSLVAGATRMADWIAKSSGPVPRPRKAKSIMQLADLIGNASVAEIEATGALRFHAVGDTGTHGEATNNNQQALSDQMASDYTVGDDAHNPAFFYHLGDVVYGANKDAEGYLYEFYRPYMKYPGKIVAIPGNHDGEILPGTDPVPLRAFQANFCTPSAVVPHVADLSRIFRQTVTQPGVYFMLRAPFVDVVGLYSNTAEGQGNLLGANGDDRQVRWLTATLSALAKERKKGARKALLLATHHPPYSRGGHSGSTGMLGTISDACDQAKILPDAVLSGHAHNYQRYERVEANGQHTPYVVAGGGGHNFQRVNPVPGGQPGDHTLEKSYDGYGYLLVSASPTELVIDFHPAGGTAKDSDTVTVQLDA